MMMQQFEDLRFIPHHNIQNQLHMNEAKRKPVSLQTFSYPAQIYIVYGNPFSKGHFTDDSETIANTQQKAVVKHGSQIGASLRCSSAVMSLSHWHIMVFNCLWGRDF